MQKLQEESKIEIPKESQENATSGIKVNDKKSAGKKYISWVVEPTSSLTFVDEIYPHNLQFHLDLDFVKHRRSSNEPGETKCEKEVPTMVDQDSKRKDSCSHSRSSFCSLCSLFSDDPEMLARLERPACSLDFIPEEPESENESYMEGKNNYIE